MKRQKPPTNYGELVEKSKIDLDAMDNKQVRYDLFLTWLKGRTGKEVKEILELENLYNMAKGEYYNKIANKLRRNLALDNNDISHLKFMKDTLESLHKIKYGTKTVNINAAVEIRDTMFKEEK